MTDELKGCKACQGTRWVCEDHAEVPWNDGDGCCRGAGMPCRLCNTRTSPIIPEDAVQSVGEDALREAVTGIKALIADFRSGDAKLEILSKSPNGEVSCRYFMKTKKLEPMLETLITYALQSQEKLVEVTVGEVVDVMFRGHMSLSGGHLAAYAEELAKAYPSGLKIVEGE